MVEGGCLCGRVRYELAGGLGPVTLCHCRYCRRAHGAPFAALSLVPTTSLRFGKGADVIREVHTPGVGVRAFCSECGSRLYNRPESTDRFTMLVVGSLDDDRDVRPLMHINLESKSGWYEIRDELPRYEGLPDAALAALRAGE
jgi:hypothetical protein